MYDKFIEANRYPDEDKRKLKIKRLLHILPPHHSETLKHMAEHLNKVASYGNINKVRQCIGMSLIDKTGIEYVYDFCIYRVTAAKLYKIKQIYKIRLKYALTIN